MARGTPGHQVHIIILTVTEYLAWFPFTNNLCLSAGSASLASSIHSLTAFSLLNHANMQKEDLIYRAIFSIWTLLSSLSVAEWGSRWDKTLASRILLLKLCMLMSGIPVFGSQIKTIQGESACTLWLSYLYLMQWHHWSLFNHTRWQYWEEIKRKKWHLWLGNKSKSCCNSAGGRGRCAGWRSCNFL